MIKNNASEKILFFETVNQKECRKHKDFKEMLETVNDFLINTFFVRTYSSLFLFHFH